MPKNSNLSLIASYIRVTGVKFHQHNPTLHLSLHPKQIPIPDRLPLLSILVIDKRRRLPQETNNSIPVLHLLESLAILQPSELDQKGDH